MKTRFTDTVPLPRTRDIGNIDAPLLVCGGAYSNLEALEALFEAASGLGIPPARIIHTGDVVAYCADPEACARSLKDSGAHAIQGNVEESLAARQPDCGCGFEDGTLCQQLSEKWFAHADERIDADLRRWMGGLPLHLTFAMAGRQARVVHGGVGAVNAYRFASLPDETFEAEFADANADMIVAGHSGLPFTRRVGGKVWHNSGALGLPANDGTPRAWYSLLHPEGNRIRIEHRALAYDHGTARAKMVRTGLPGGYADALATGLWPSLTVLPEAETRQTGVPLAECEIVLEAAPAPAA